MIAEEFPGQFPAEELYNLDYRDEDRWWIEARKKKLRGEISQIYLTNLAFSGGEMANEKLRELNDELAAWEGKDLKEERAVSAWEWLGIKGRG